VGDNSQMRIAGVGTVPSKGMHKGMVVNINEAKETIRDSVKRASSPLATSVNLPILASPDAILAGRITRVSLR